MEQANPGGEKRANFQKWSLYSWKKMKSGLMVAKMWKSGHDLG
jgi:hypothetical protein